MKSESEVTQSCLTLCDPKMQPTRLLRPWDFPGKSPGVVCHLVNREGNEWGSEPVVLL